MTKDNPTKVLIIGYVWPEPRSSAAGSRMLQLLETFLGQGWQVTFGSAALLSEERANLTALGISEITLALNCDSFDDYLRELQPDIVLFDRFFTEEQFGWRVARTCPNALRILDTEDLHSLRFVRAQQVKAAQKIVATEPEKYAIELLAKDDHASLALMAGEPMALREIAAIFRSDLSLIIATTEFQLLQTHFAVPAALLLYCPLTIVAPLTLPSFSARKNFITIGNFRHEPNWDAVLCLKHSIWPAIRALLPQAELHVYGAYMPPKASALHNPKQGFYLRGWANDAHQVMQEARVCLAPLRFGAGVKGKLLEAMACGTPNITSPIGAESLASNLPWGGVIAATTTDFVTAAVKLYQQEAIWQKAQQNGQAIIAAHFSATQAVVAHTASEQTLTKPETPLLIGRLDQIRENLVGHRQSNFIGQMLQHHFHKSTQYMSQWIAAKNRP